MSKELETAIELAQLEKEIIELRRSNLHLQSKLIKAKAKVDDLVVATRDAAYLAVIDLGGIGNVKEPPKDTRKAREAAVIWHLTDWQGGKRTPTYNSDIMEKRVNLFIKKAGKLVEDYRKARPVKECFILFGGDMVEGCFNFPSQVWELDSTIFEQYVKVSKLMVETVQKALSMFEKVTVVAEFGNHGRIGSKRDSHLLRNDNFDRMCYELARQLLAGEKRLTWEDCPNDWQPVVIGNYRAILVHGDEWSRNGFSSTAGILTNVTKWKAGSLGFDFVDCFVGHYHVHASHNLSDGLGQVYQTGSTESDNRYAQIQLASMAVPSQRMHVVDIQKGRTIGEHKIWLDGE